MKIFVGRTKHTYKFKKKYVHIGIFKNSGCNMFLGKTS